MRRAILAFLASFSILAAAYETDQFTTPTRELLDSGPAFSRFISNKLHELVARFNSERSELPLAIVALEAEIGRLKVQYPNRARLSGPRSDTTLHDRLKKLERRAAEMRARLALLRSEAGILRAVTDELGTLMTWQDQRDGVFGAELTVFDFNGTRGEAPLNFLPPATGNIHSFAGFHRGVSPTYFVLSSTFRMFGVHLGGDKLGHFINQGYEYFELYQAARSRGASEEEAVAAAVADGVRSESGFFGRIVDGVYSNADLAANFAGFWFFRNFFGPIEIFGVRYPAILSVGEAGALALSEDPSNQPDVLLKRFFTQHLNEALNPSEHETLQRSVIRGEIQARCPKIRQFYRLGSREQARELTEGLRLWSGQEYGHLDENALKIADLCF